MPNVKTISSSQPLVTGAPRSAFRRLAIQLGQYLVVGAMAVATYLLISRFVVQTVTVTGPSMMPTLHDADRFLLNRWIYLFRSPHAADIVVLRDPTADCLAVKRVVGLPGDQILIKNGKVYLNGRLLQEFYLPAHTMTFTLTCLRGPVFKCGPGQFFVLGDNRGNSIDSRAYGPVPRGNILGMIVR